MTWVDDRHVGCARGDAAEHGWCRIEAHLTCEWCGHLECRPPQEESWLTGTFEVLRDVAQERLRQFEKHGDAMSHLPDGTGPLEKWLYPVSDRIAALVESDFREDYEKKPDGQLTRMHLIREEIAEAFELESDNPDFQEEILQVAALCVQWVEILRR